uniref:Uncharacterized protein ycf35 n=1 Tax=Plumaria plumosa TaxID=189642 RepID=A0A4D6WZV9_9FLOR|nr:hypothetical protein [Plumaria plumosa]
MSHFSKIKTNISNLEILQKTLEDLGFKYKLFKDIKEHDYLNIYNYEQEDVAIFSFQWNDNEYSLITDLQLWNLSIEFNAFIEKLNQRYALNTILEQSINNGFEQAHQKMMSDGSLRLVVNRWHYE